MALSHEASAQTSGQAQQDARDLEVRSNLVQGAGARAFGMGGAFLARPDDATAASWNPAGLSYLRSVELSLVGAYTKQDAVQTDIDESVTLSDRRTGRAPDFLAVTKPFEIRSATGSLQLSFQRVSSFDGSRTITQPGTPPRVRQFEILGGFDVIAFGSGIQATHDLRFGFTINRWRNGYSYTLDRQAQGRPSRQTIDFRLSGWNLNLGLIWSPIEQLNLAAVYKTRFRASVDLERSRVDLVTPPSSNQFESSDINLAFPAAFGVGASWRPTTPLTLSADYSRTQWSRGRIYNYFTLPITPDTQQRYAILPFPTLGDEARQRDAEQLRAGVEYVLILGRLKLPLRAGCFADRQLFATFNPETQLRDKIPVYQGYAAGTGISVGRLLLDLAWVHQRGHQLEADLEADDPTPRDTSFRSHRVFVSLIYRHKR